jgi:hypothetical protein
MGNSDGSSEEQNADKNVESKYDVHEISDGNEDSTDY